LTENEKSIILLIENHFHLYIQMTGTGNQVKSILRRKGFKITPQRLAILDIVTSSHEHLTPAEIFERVSHEHPGIGLVTIYRTLEMLAELGLICEMHLGGNCRSYLMRRPSVHHHHLICSECGMVIDFTDCNLDELEERLCRETDFTISGHLLEFLGQCPECGRKAVARQEGNA
jgi:Fur family ferric uptake transcriptional regulator